MQIRRCECCTKMFSPKSYGINAILCRCCVMDADEAYTKVYQSIKRDGFRSPEEIGESIGINAALIKGLILDGRFQGSGGGGDIDSVLQEQRKRQLLDMMGGRPSATCAGVPAASSPPESGGRSRQYGLGRS